MRHVTKPVIPMANLLIKSSSTVSDLVVLEEHAMQKNVRSFCKFAGHTTVIV